MRSGYAAKLPSRVGDKRLPPQTAGKGITMASALSASRQFASDAGAACPKASNTNTPDDGLSAFLSMRSRLFGIAYRVLFALAPLTVALASVQFAVLLAFGLFNLAVVSRVVFPGKRAA